MRSSRISNSTHLQMLKACGAVEVYATRGGMWAIFDAEFQLVGDDGGVEGVAPALTCLTDDVESLQLGHEDLVRIGERSYRVRSHHPDGTGQSILILKQ